MTSVKDKKKHHLRLEHPCASRVVRQPVNMFCLQARFYSHIQVLQVNSTLIKGLRPLLVYHIIKVTAILVVPGYLLKICACLVLSCYKLDTENFPTFSG